MVGENTKGGESPVFSIKALEDEAVEGNNKTQKEDDEDECPRFFVFLDALRPFIMIFFI